MTAISTNTTALAARRRETSSLAERFQLWLDLRATRKALSKLSDRELDDIGLSRYEAMNFGVAR